MTVEQFRATKKVARTHMIERVGYRCEDEAIAVLVYADSFYIEQLPEGKYFLMLTVDSYVSEDLADLEAKLYEYALHDLEVA